MRKFKDVPYIYDSNINDLAEQVQVAGEAINAINKMESFKGRQSQTRVRLSILAGLAEVLDRPTPKKKKEKKEGK